MRSRPCWLRAVKRQLSSGTGDLGIWGMAAWPGCNTTAWWMAYRFQRSICQKRNAESYRWVKTEVKTVKLQAYSPQKGSPLYSSRLCVLYQKLLPYIVFCKASHITPHITPYVSLKEGTLRKLQGNPMYTKDSLR